MGSVRVAPAAASVAHVRTLIRHDLAVLPEPVREDAALVVSELLANALRHARTLADAAFEVTWGVGELGVEIAVADGGSESSPRVLEPGDSDVRGRGLAIVQSIALSWGVEQAGGRTTVWAIVPLHQSRSLLV